MLRERRITFLIAVLVILLAGCGSEAPAPDAAPAAAPTPPFDEMGRTDQETEQLTHLLLKVGRDLASSPRQPVAPAFASDFAGRPFPAGTGEESAEDDWIVRRSWTLDGVAAVGRDAFLTSLDTFLKAFSSVESVVFEIPSSTSPFPGELEGTVRLAMVARDGEGRRAWVRGEGKLKGRRGERRWELTGFDLETLSALVASRDLFNDVAAPAGVAAADRPLHEAVEKLEHWYPNGAAAVDADRDGLLDLFVTGPEVNHLYRNQGDGTFDDVAEAVGLRTMRADQPEFSPLFFDFDNDGDADLFLTAPGGYLLFENLLVPDGELSFIEASLGLGVVSKRQGWSVAAADVDGDGRTDVYVPSYASGFGGGPVAKTTIWDKDGDENVLFMNRGDGTFVEEGRLRGVADRRFGLAAQFADVDGDGDPDLYLANDYGGGNALFINDGKGNFQDEAAARGVEHAAQSMGVSFGDVDQDGDLDLFVTNMSSTSAARSFHRFDGYEMRHREHFARQWSGHALFMNRGDGTFEDVSREAGPFRGGWGWGGGFLDLDNDGDLDLHVPNGFFSGAAPIDARAMVFGIALVASQKGDAREMENAMDAAMTSMNQQIRRGGSFAGWERDLVLLNRDGRFFDVSGISGADSLTDGRAAVYADFDNDGDLDVFLRATHGPSHFLFRNEIGQDRGWLRVALEGRTSARDAFGAVVRVRTATRTLTAPRRASNGYLAQGDPRLLFGLGEEKSVEWIEVAWPSGLVEKITGPFASGTSLHVVEGEKRADVVRERRFALPEPAG